MSPDGAAQIIAKAWPEANLARALRGPTPSQATRHTLGVDLPADTLLPAIPPPPAARVKGFGVRSGVRAGAPQGYSPPYHYNAYPSS
jgi:hypothetical protein